LAFYAHDYQVAPNAAFASTMAISSPGAISAADQLQARGRSAFAAEQRVREFFGGRLPRAAVAAIGAGDNEWKFARRFLVRANSISFYSLGAIRYPNSALDTFLPLCQVRESELP
jgi:hypothetical protein